MAGLRTRHPNHHYMTRTKTRTADDWFARMQQEFRSARFKDAAQTYDEAVRAGKDASSDAVLLRARIYLKNDSEKVTPFLLKRHIEKPKPVQIARRAMYLGTGYARLGEFGEADQYFAEAKTASRGETVRGELAAHLTRRYLSQRDFASAETWQRESLVDRSLAGKIRSEHLQSYIFARRELYGDQGFSLLKVLDLIGERRDEFVEDYCVASYTLAVLARELPIEAFGTRAKLEIDAEFSWPGDLGSYRFQALKGVAWCQALNGDELSCLRYLRFADHVASNDIWRVMLLCDRSYFASIVGEERWAANEFSAAEELADSVEWDRTSGEERVALLLLAELAARQMPKRAPYYLGRFNELGKLRSHLQHFAFDDRLAAMANFTSGIVREAAGENEAAQDHLRSAWTTFDRIGYAVRAARVASALYRVTKKSRWMHLAEDNLEHYPKSWLTQELPASLPPSPANKSSLTKMQDHVMRLVCEGLSTDAMADRLKLSRNTVLNHLKAIYKKLGVNSREALVVTAMRDRLL
jgi:DNA-binding CsgD family transcriptional regulator